MWPEKNIYWVGLPGAGKTTIGKVLSKILNKDFFDSDHVLIKRTGVTIKTIFDVEGEYGFREREKKVIQDLTVKRNIVLATGGGAILDSEVRNVLKTTGIVVYLDADPDFLFQRMKKDTIRPLLQGVDIQKKLQSLFEQRNPLYNDVSHFSYLINEANGSHYHCAKEIIKQLHLEFSDN